MENNKPSTVLALVILLLISLSSGCVSKSTFQGVADQAKKLDSDLTDLQKSHQALQKQQEILTQEKFSLENDKANLLNSKAGLEQSLFTLQKEKSALEDANASLKKEKDSLAAGNKELEEILAAREDTLSKKIAGLRQEMTNLTEDCNRHLTDQSKQIADRNQLISDQTEQINECASRIAAGTDVIASTTADNHRLAQELQQLRADKETETQQMGSTYQDLIDKMKSEIDHGQITISELKGKLTVNLIDAILFDSGKAEIKPEGLKVLQKVIDILKGVAGKTIRIEGHTDNIPIVGGLAQKYPSNWELAAARAVNVTKFLQERGIDPHILNAVAHGEFKPVADNGSESGRAQNRRIEIVLANQD